MRGLARISAGCIGRAQKKIQANLAEKANAVHLCTYPAHDYVPSCISFLFN